ncbi:uncharacterized protein BJ171DRAFT_453827 [Polychytrium aggregatum]|uniref:uncharacterized protein n=1 Tax=Polychytrium aggregatum TaxID=110093 RepID=UPI0022FEF69B|nr:uncharacterized protein BJ171DRAFT_453827 [Polychytrium aggregatum]KAI9209674.1 hypothetical protein BJ171DRAFT_453827 [Polychytrium aggregatum]
MELLREKFGDAPVPSSAAIDHETFNRLIQTNSSSAPGSSQRTGIPKFFTNRRTTSHLQQLLQREAYDAFSDQQADNVLSGDELDMLWDALIFDATDEEIAQEDRRITYTDYCNIKFRLPAKFHQYFLPSTFLRLLKEGQNTISICQYFNYLMRKVSLFQGRLDLGAYDADCDGYLTEDDLQMYIEDLIPQMNLDDLNEHLHKFYVCTAVRKFSFFLDPMRIGKISITSILLSPILTELFELRDRDLNADAVKTNWFSAYSSLRVYGQYLNLDMDHNGMLSRRELAKYSSGTFTELFTDRVFQEYQTYGGEMDYKAFLDFVLAMENIQTPEAITYCFRLLDINSCGYLDDFVLGYFFKGVCAKMVAFGHETPPVDDVINEIIDMANPKTYRQIRCQGKSKPKLHWVFATGSPSRTVALWFRLIGERHGLMMVAVAGYERDPCNRYQQI